MNIGKRIRELREEKNLSQEEVANAIGVTKQMISHYEGGVNVPRGGKIRKLAELFGVTEEEFYTKTKSNFTKDGTDDEVLRAVKEALGDAQSKLYIEQEKNKALRAEIERLRKEIIELQNTRNTG